MEEIKSVSDRLADPFSVRHSGVVKAAQISLDGSKLASASDDKKVMVR